MEKAGFWRLAAAYTIDLILLSIAGGILGIIVGIFISGILGAMGADVATLVSISALAGSILGFILNVVYFAALESTVCASLGKKWLGIKVYKA